MKQIDRLRNMNAEELAEELFFHNFGHCHTCKRKNVECSGDYFDDKSCIFGIREWLESEVEE